MISRQRRGTIAKLLIVPIILLGACSKKVDGMGIGTGARADLTVSGSVVVSGSSTVAPITNLVREEFIAQNSKVDIVVDGPGTGDGFKLFCAGRVDIADASRPIKQPESEDCTAAGIEYIELKIGIDGMSIVVPDTNKVACLSFADLYALAGPESEGFSRWNHAQGLARSLGSSTIFPNRNLVITAPGTESGTYDSFVEIVLDGITRSRVESGDLEADAAHGARADYSAGPDDNSIIEAVASDPGGLGWVGFAFAEQAERVRLMSVSESPGGPCVTPSAATIQDGSYPISRSLYIYINKAKAQKSPALAAFVDFYLEGLTGFVEFSDYIALADPSPTLRVWADRTSGTHEKAQS